MKHSEFHLHTAIAAYLGLNEDPYLWTWFHVPNGERRDKGSGAKLKRMGVRAGVPDIVIDHHGRITCVDIKGTGGSLSPAQRQWRDAALSRGASFHVVKSIEDMEAVLTKIGAPLRARLAA